MVRLALEYYLEQKPGESNRGLRLAELLLGQHVDQIAICASLLACSQVEGQTNLESIKHRFNPEVIELAHKILSARSLEINGGSYHRGDLEDFLSSVGKDLRFTIVRLVFRLAELESFLNESGDYSRQLARETLDLYVPLANRLGMAELKKRLEDMAFQILEPEKYEELFQIIGPIQAEDKECLKIIKDGVHLLLERHGVTASIEGRTKSLYGIWRKMLARNATLYEIMDRIGVRIIVPTVPECYTVLGILHRHFRPIPGTFDDYIGLPKDNGYQSLHSCVYPVRDVSRKPIEFQIRTELMHMEAEYGMAAHWRYKSAEAIAADNLRQSQWMDSLVGHHQSAESAEEFIKLLKRQVYESHMVIFGKGGQILRLPEKATVRDYVRMFNPHAYADLPVKVNGEFANMDRKLCDGDTVEILEGENPAPVAHDGGLLLPFLRSKPPLLEKVIEEN